MTDAEKHTELEHEDGLNEAVEPEGLNPNAVGVVVVGGIVFIIAAMFVAVQVTGLFFQEAITESTAFTGYPLLEQTEAQGEELLSGYAAVDSDAGIYRIPIERAMELVVQESESSNPGEN